MKVRIGGDDEKGKEEKWDRAVPYIEREEERVMRPVIGWQRPWAKDGREQTPLVQAFWRQRWRARGTCGLCARTMDPQQVSPPGKPGKKRLC